MNWFERISQNLARKLFWVAGAAIIGMMLLTCADVILRYFRMPIPGTYELVCFLGAVAVAFAMAYTSLERGHVSVSFVVQLVNVFADNVVLEVLGVVVLHLGIVSALVGLLLAEALGS